MLGHGINWRAHAAMTRDLVMNRRPRTIVGRMLMLAAMLAVLGASAPVQGITFNDGGKPIHLMNPDGTDRANITNSAGVGSDPPWSD